MLATANLDQAKRAFEVDLGPQQTSTAVGSLCGCYLLPGEQLEEFEWQM